MILICPCCGAESSERDQAQGRCGKCGSFFSGQEVVVDAPLSLDPSLAAGPPGLGEDGSIRTAADSTEVPAANSPTPVDDEAPAVFEPPSPPAPAEEEDSESLVRPRRLSPQFRRHVEMTWQPSLASNERNAERTLSAHAASDSTKHDHSTLSIGTRKITPDQTRGSGDYVLNDVIGEGSMGRVWSARQTSLDRNVAVKVPRPELASAGSVGEGQFISEVVVTGKLEHPNIVPIYELGRDTNGLPFYSMKHVQGRPWNELIADKSERENIEILMKVCDAIAFAHDRDFLHRDIKPHNVMVGEFGEVSVMDWGIAVSLSRDPTRAWAAVASGPAGTPAYMAPEMAAFNPSELGVVSDVYLLGAVLYEIVTGTPPHPRTGDTNEALLAAAANDIIRTPKSGELVDIARRAMATKLEDRYQSVQAFQDALREYQSHRESSTLAESAAQHLAQAQREGSSDEFARARFAYEEALRLWAGNTAAAAGLRTATLAHAQNALEQENFELGISILDPQVAEHRPLLSRLESKRAARQRLARFSKLTAAAAIIATLTVVVVTVWKNNELASTNSNLDQANSELATTNADLDQANSDLDEKRKAAERAEAEALKAKDAALRAKRLAREAEAEAQREKRRTEEASYASDIGLAAESIRRNSFSKASIILEGLTPQADAGSIRSRLRHIEWGILQHASAPQPVQNLLPSGHVEAVASSRDGSVLAAGTEEGEVYLWLPADRQQPLQTPPIVARHGTALRALALSSQGDFLATAGVDPRPASTSSELQEYAVKIWAIPGGQPLQPQMELIGHTAEVLSVEFSKDASQVLTSAADRTAVVWDRSSGKRLATLRDHLEKRVWCARFSPTEREIVTACEDGRVRVWQLGSDTAAPRKIHDFRGHEGPVYAVVFSTDGQTVFSGGYDRRLLQWSLQNTPQELAMQQGDDLQALLEGSAVATQEISLVGQENQQHEASIHALSIELVDNQECILSGGNDNTLRLWQQTADGWDLEKILRGHGRWVRACSFSAAGKAVLSGAYDGLKRWDWEAYSMPRELYPNSERRVGSESSEVGRSAASQARYSPDGRWIATAYANGTVAVWDAAANEQMPSQLLVDGHAFLTDTGIFYDNGGRLLTSAGDNTTRLWDVSRSTQMHSLQGTGWRGTAAVSWRPQESTAWIVTGSDDRLIPAWLWRVSDGKPISKQPLLTDYAQSVLTQLAHTAQRPVQYAAAQSPLGKLPTADVDRLHRWMDKIPDVTAVAFSDSGDRLLIGNSGGHCFLYHLPTATAAPQQVAQFTVAGSSVRAATFLPSGDSVITASAEGQLQQWDAAQGQLQRLLPGSAPVTSLAVSPNGHRLLVGYAPLEGHSMPIARLLNIASPNAGVQAELLASNRLASRDWQANPPVVQSIRFAPKSNRALLSLFFPTRKGGEAANSDATQTGYELGYWNWDQQNLDFQSLVTPISGEVASTAFGEGPSDSQLLVVGGKGARLLAPATDREAFTRLTASFRPANTITCLGFSYDPTRHLSNRLAAGDSEGNVRVWERNAGQWSENSGAAVQLTGRHNAPLVATVFDPQRPNRLLTADQTGKWILWQFDGDWQIQQQFVPQPQAPRAHCAMFSPDGQRVFLGSETRAQQWRRQADDRYETTESHGIAEKVQAAAYSADGCWLVTFDGENAVKFWDASGQIASLADEDAEAITAMALSHDRRRFFTAHQDRRIVIWDTSKLEDTQRGDRSQNEKLIHELLTLEGHRRGVTSIAVAPNGRQLLSAGEEGRTILWTGEPIRPMSLTLSRTQIPYQRGSGEMKIDARVVVADPSQLADFAQAELRIALQGATFPHERLHFGPSTESSGAAIDIRPDGSIYYQPQQDASGIAIGQLLSDTPQLKHIALQPTADAAALQVLLRTLTYSVAAPDTFSTPTQDAVPTAETSQLVQGDRQQTVTIQLTGVRERDDRGDPRPLTPQELRASGLQASLVIDIE